MLTIDQQDDTIDIRLYPNPATNEFFIKAQGPIEQIRLYDQLGRRIPFEYETLTNNQYRIPCSELPSGIYWVQMRYNKQIFTKKIIHLNKN